MKVLDSVLNLLKKIPVDFGQESVSETTQGKRIAMSLVRRGDGRVALDVGCRKGVQSRWLEAQGYEVTSIDIEKNYPKCLVVDVNEGLPFEDGQFDLIWCSEVIEHLDKPEEAIAEFRRVTKTGGEIILTTPNSFFWLFRLFSFFGLPPEKLQRKDHLYFFSWKDIRRIFPGAQIMGFFPYMFVKATIRMPALVGFLSPTFVVRFIKKDNFDV